MITPALQSKKLSDPPFILRFTKEPPLSPPEAPKTPHKFPDGRQDPFFWMKNLNDPRLTEYLKEWDIYCDAYFEKLKNLSASLFNELKSSFVQDETTVPKQIGEWHYYEKYKGLDDHPSFFRKKVGSRVEELCFDTSRQAKDHSYFDLINEYPSLNGSFIVYEIDISGSEVGDLYIQDLNHKESLSIIQRGTEVIWAKDSQGFFYTAIDDKLRSHAVYYYDLKEERSLLVFQEGDEEYYVTLTSDKLNNHLFINSSSRVSVEVWIADLQNPDSPLRQFYKREPYTFIQVDASDEFYYALIHKNDEISLFQTNFTNISERMLIFSYKGIADKEIDSISVFKDFIAFEIRKNFLPAIEIMRWNGEKRVIPLPEKIGHLFPLGNKQFDIEKFRFYYSSPLIPPSINDYNIRTGGIECVKSSSLKGFNSGKYTVERLWALAHDGEKIPITIVFPKGMVRDGSHPMRVMVYGAYGKRIDPKFSSTSNVMLEKGVIQAYVHVRGGGEKGPNWYMMGRGKLKINSIEDFISSIKYLHTQGFSSPQKTAIEGHSAGGVVIAGALNKAPHLFKAAILQSPFTDVLTTLLDPNMPLTKLEYTEFGNPEKEEFYETIRSYSPQDNIRRVDYPSLYVSAGIKDQIVGPHESIKWVAKLVDFKTDENPVILRVNRETGHFGDPGRISPLKQTAEIIAFILHELGVV